MNECVYFRQVRIPTTEKDRQEENNYTDRQKNMQWHGTRIQVNTS